MNNLDRHTLGEERREAWEKREERRETGEETEEIKETEERREAGEDIQILGLRLSEETGIGEEQQPRRLPGGGGAAAASRHGEEEQPCRRRGGATATSLVGRSSSRVPRGEEHQPSEALRTSFSPFSPYPSPERVFSRA